MTLEEIYQKLPIPLQQLAVNLEGWRTVRKNYGGDFHKFLQQAESRTFWPQEQIKTFRDQRLKAFIGHCYETVPYYRKLFKSLKIVPDDIKTLDDLKILPILTKQEVQDHFLDLVSDAVPPRKRLLIKTSGTTGGAIHFYTTKQAIQEQWAVWWRYRRWHGIQLNTWCAYFTGRAIVPLNQNNPPYWRYNYPGKKVHFSAFHLNEKTISSYVNIINKLKLPWIHGYPSLLSLFASLMMDKKLTLDYHVKWVTVGSENLLPQQKELIKKAIGISPKQNYGSEEAIANFSECEFGNLHVDEDFAATWFLPITSSDGYKIIGSNLSNYATPLLNYDVQDNISYFTYNNCSCKRPGRIISNVDGRMEDYIILKNGNKVGRLEHTFTNFLSIREAQIYQKNVDEITVRIVRGNNYSLTEENNIILALQKRIGFDIKINIQYVENIERSKRGKLRFVISEIPHGKLEM